MPDKRTVYIMDDGTNKILTVFVADKAGDLSAGNMYTIKFTQVSSVDGGK